MKHVRIVLSLLVVVVLMTLAVFGVENAFREDIDRLAAERANEAKEEVLEGALTYPTAVDNMIGEEALEYKSVDIVGIWHFEGLGYVYQVKFAGHANEVEYIFGFDEDGNVTGYKTLKAAETRGNINSPDSWLQFNTKTISDLAVGDIDGWTGATNTTTYWKESFVDVMDYHNNTILNQTTVDVTSEFPGRPDSVTKIEKVEQSGATLEYVYYVTFQGFIEEDSTFKFTVNANNHSVKSLVILTINDTPEIGGHIADPEFAAQFIGMDKVDATQGNYDDLGGATYPATLEKFEAAFAEAFFFHREEVEGYVVPVETPEERLYRLHEELSIVEVELTDISSDFNLSNSKVSMVEESNDFIFFTATFIGYNQIDGVTVLVAIEKDSNQLSGMKVISQSETSGIGGNIDTSNYLAQFESMNYILPYLEEIDSITGATMTTNGLKGALKDIAKLYRVDILGLDPIGSAGFSIDDFVAEKAVEIYPTATQFINVSTSNPADHRIDEMYEIQDASNTVLGYIFAGEAEGASYVSTTYIKFIVAINEDKTFDGFYLYDDNETVSQVAAYYEAAYSILFSSIDIEADNYVIDEEAGATATHTAILVATREIAKYYVEEVLGLEFARPLPVATDNADLLAAYPTATSFNEVYSANLYNDKIQNMYEALDGSGTVIGYVYRGYAAGSAFLNVDFTWGVDLSGLTQSVNVIEHATSWDWAPDYSGSQTFPDNQTFTNEFEAIQINSILDTEVNIDSWSGVSTTTGGLRTVFEIIAQYHIDNVGGGN